MNRLMAIPVVGVLVGLLWPFVALDGQKEYLEWVLQNPDLVARALGAWGVVLYWLTRRGAEVLFLRGAGEKLRVRK